MIYSLTIGLVSLCLNYYTDPCGFQQIDISMNTEPSTSMAINNCLQAAGFGTSGTQTNQPYGYYLYYQVVLLPNLGSPSGQALAINDTGNIVGWSADSFSHPRAFLYDYLYGTVDLGTLGGTDSTAIAINNASQIVGKAQIKNGTFHAFLWQDGQMTDLTPDSPTQTVASAINDCGFIVGSIVKDDKTFAAVIYPSVVILPTLGGKVSEACAVNDRAQIVGFSQTPDSKPHAFLYESGRFIQLAPDLEQSVAYGINAKGDIVGKAMINSSWRAVLWSYGTMIQLPDETDIESIAYSINDRGFIAGQVTASFSKSSRATLWQPPGYTPLVLNCK